MAITTKQQRQQRRNEALQLISSGVPPTDAATQLTRVDECKDSIRPTREDPMTSSELWDLQES